MNVEQVRMLLKFCGRKEVIVLLDNRPRGSYVLVTIDVRLHLVQSGADFGSLYIPVKNVSLGKNGKLPTARGYP